MDFENLSLTELKERAKEVGIKNISKLKKDELISLLNEQDKAKENTSNVSDGGYKLTSEGDEVVEGILEVLPDGYGFLRGDNYLSSPKDVYVSPVYRTLHCHWLHHGSST